MLLEEGHTVIASIRGGEERFRKLFAEELKIYPDRLHTVDLHMDKPETFNLAVDLIDQRFGGKLDVLVNNAGYGLFGAIEDQSHEQLRAQMEVNFFGPVFLSRALLPALRKARGRIINVSSIAGRSSFPLYGAYNASKFALEGISEAMHYDLKPQGVQVCLVEPGAFKTGFTTSTSAIYAEGLWNPHSPYRARTQALKAFTSASEMRLGNAARVYRLLAALCEKRRIPLRAPIGIDSRFLIWFGRIVPLGIRIRLIDLVFRLVVFKRS